MSAVEQQTESRSSVKLSRNARGDCQIELKVYAGEESAGGHAAMVAEAVEMYDSLCIRYGIQAGVK